MRISKEYRKMFLELCLKQASFSYTNTDERIKELSQYLLPKINLSVPFIICGAWAANNYMAPRATQDVDIIVRPEDLDNAVDELKSKGYTLDGTIEVEPRNSLKELHGFRLVNQGSLVPIIEILTCKDEWLEEAYIDSNTDLSGNKVLSIPYLTLMKIDRRAKDAADLTQILGHATGDVLEKTKDVILKHNPNCTDDLANIVLIGKIEAGK